MPESLPCKNKHPLSGKNQCRSLWAQVYSTLFHKLYGEKWQFEIELYFIRSEAVLKSEIRISKHETISNDRNLNEINRKREYHTAFVLNFNHLDFDIVSDFVF